jgi:hypothetical protein
MRYLGAIILGFALALPAPAAAGQRDPSRRDAELDEVLRLLEKSDELNPRDPVVYYYMFQVLNMKYTDRSERYRALVEQGKGASPEAKMLRREIEQLWERLDTVMRRLGVPDLPGPVDTPVRPRTTPDHPGR